MHVLKAGTLRPVAVQLGISDGRFTEVTGGPLTEGDLVVTGLATARVSGSSGRAFGMRGP